MAFFLAYLWAISSFIIHPVLGDLPPDISLFLLLNTDLDDNQALSFNLEADPFDKGIYMRDVLQGPTDIDFWYFNQTHLGNNDYSATTTDADPLVWIYGADQIVIGHTTDGALDRSSSPATWIFLQQDDGTWTINTYDKRFLGLDLTNTSLPKLYPQQGSEGAHQFWSLIPIPTITGDVASWTTVTTTVAAPTLFLVGDEQVTNTVTVTKTSTQPAGASNAPSTEKWTRSWTLPTSTVLASTGLIITNTWTVEITPSTTITSSGTASPATVDKTVTLTEVVSVDAQGSIVKSSSIQTGVQETVFLPDDIVNITSTAWIDDATFTEVATVTIPVGTVPARSSTISSVTSATFPGHKKSGCGRLEREMGVVVCLFVFCFPWVELWGLFDG